jgi:hypothetical protein
MNNPVRLEPLPINAPMDSPAPGVDALDPGRTGSVEPPSLPPSKAGRLLIRILRMG